MGPLALVVQEENPLVAKAAESARTKDGGEQAVGLIGAEEQELGVVGNGWWMRCGTVPTVVGGWWTVEREPGAVQVGSWLLPLQGSALELGEWAASKKIC